eukprot:CAMPEP_0181333668 /NCGR_PEP_ID=MMETSP1101-20121128/25805_1 /TAXON_ID=46948 /ORGANISM="Rhodomonas abbreviata, Strain Caron Lab Isolate" /LENGTH=230 /DNA_ID=CAMNT_0023443505 /DNA_START=38 /DNA_END=727 /DNA_ORIENTATION=-
MACANVGEIWYFALRARAEPLRMLASHAKLAYTDRIITFPEWGELKATCPGGGLPVLKLPSGELMGESGDILLHIAKQAPPELQLVPADEKLAAAATLMYTTINTPPVGMVNPLNNWFSAEESAAKLPEALPPIFAKLAGLTDALKDDKPFFGGDKPHWAEFGLFHILNNLKNLKGGNDGLRQLGEKWVRWYANFGELPGVKEYVANRPRSGTGETGKEGSLMATTNLDA